MVLYFAYGSNMEEGEMDGLCEKCKRDCKRDCDGPAFSFQEVAKLYDYQLAFNRCSILRGCGVADIIERRGSFVEGVMYNVPEKCVCALRKKEGYPTAYDEITVTVKSAKGRRVEALTYAVRRKSGRFIPPNEEYKTRILRGAEFHGLGEQYIREVLEPVPTSEEDCLTKRRGNTRTEIGHVVRSCIDEVARDFICNPWSFYSEPDVHALLYCCLGASLEEVDMLYSTLHEGERTNLLFREYPTRRAYSWKGRNKRRANFDLAILDKDALRNGPHPRARRDFPGISPDIGIEVKLDVTDKRWEDEMSKCLAKLEEIANPKHRFLLFLARRTRFKFYDEFRKWVKERENKVEVKYVRVHPKKLSSDFEGLWL